MLFSNLCTITAFLSFTFGILIAVNRNKTSLKSSIVLWSFFCFAVGFWSLGLGKMTSSSNIETANFWLIVHYFGAILIPTLYLHYVLTFLKFSNKKLIYSCYFLTIVFIYLCLGNDLATPQSNPPFNFYTKPGKYYNLYSFYFFLCVAYSHFLLYKALKTSETLKKKQIYYLLIGTGIGFGGGSTAFFPVYNIPIFPFGVPFAAIYVFIVGYSILIYKFMDFSVLMRWGFVFGVTLIPLISIYSSILFIGEKISNTVLKIPTGITTILAVSFSFLIFDPILKKVKKFSDKVIFQSPDLLVLLNGIKECISKKNATLDEKCKSISMQLNIIWKTQHAGIAIYEYNESAFSFYPKEFFQNKTISKLGRKISQDDFLVRTLETERRLFHNGIVTENEVNFLGSSASPGERTTFWKIRRTMRWLNATICVPINHNERLLGFIILGLKSNNENFNQEDKKVLSHIASLISELLLEDINQKPCN